MDPKKVIITTEQKIKKLENLIKKQKNLINNLKGKTLELNNEINQLKDEKSKYILKIIELNNIKSNNLSKLNKFKSWIFRNFKFMFIFVFSLFIYDNTNSSTLNTSVIANNTNEFSEENLMFLFDSLQINHPEIALAQIKLETANYSSNIYKENNNLFGMKLPKIRNTTAIGENRGHAKFENWKQSVIDYKLWQENMISNKSSEKEYLTFLSNNYAEDENYAKKLKKIMQI